ncbi:MAG: hypothetical protein AVDCRST_MAG38-3042, partial [uncultured Solirubrobacteraceae bacterium]
ARPDRRRRRHGGPVRRGAGARPRRRRRGAREGRPRRRLDAVVERRGLAPSSLGGLPRRVPRRRSRAAAGGVGGARRRPRLARVARRAGHRALDRQSAHERPALRPRRADRRVEPCRGRRAARHAARRPAGGRPGDPGHRRLRRRPRPGAPPHHAVGRRPPAARQSVECRRRAAPGPGGRWPDRSGTGAVLRPRHAGGARGSRAGPLRGQRAALRHPRRRLGPGREPLRAPDLVGDRRGAVDGRASRRAGSLPRRRSRPRHARARADRRRHDRHRRARGRAGRARFRRGRRRGGGGDHHDARRPGRRCRRTRGAGRMGGGRRSRRHLHRRLRERAGRRAGDGPPRGAGGRRPRDRRRARARALV